MATLINGKEVATAVRERIKNDVADFIKTSGKTPGLAVVIVGTNPASQVYVRNKSKACGEVGIYSEVYELAEETSEAELLALVDELNNDEKISGILVQLPLPKHIDGEKVIAAISPIKDVDAFHTENVGRILLGKYSFLPCTPAGVMELLHHYNVDIASKHCVIIGRSNIVGKPQAMLMLKEDATVTICHSKTKDLASITKQADIIVAAVGKAGFVTGDMVKKGAVVIDVGINRGEDGKLYGDVDFATVEPKASYITPVPGGVGPMTITMLMQNTLTAAKLQNLKNQ